MSAPHLPALIRNRARFVRSSLLSVAALSASLIAAPAALTAQSVPPALEAPAARPPQVGSRGEKLIGMPKFHDPAPYDLDEHTGYKQIFDGKSFAGWDADSSIWRVEDGIMVGETLEGKPKGNNYIVYRGDKTRDFDLKLRMKIEKGGGGGIQYRSVTGTPWTRPQPEGQAPYDLKFMMTGPQADFWFPVRAQAAAHTGQWYSENTMLGILAYRGQVTQALPGQANRLVANIGDKQALGGYVKVNEWNDYEIIARGGVMMHIMNGQLMAVFIDDNKDSVNNIPGLIGFEIESQPCKISVRDIWLRKFD
ncbi:MAG: hypothetical protein JWM43_138 [Acidobacteriaceae bacterium]|nr:hypothetical protein [Acidobacteriaceae bacterium]